MHRRLFRANRLEAQRAFGRALELTFNSVNARTGWLTFSLSNIAGVSSASPEDDGNRSEKSQLLIFERGPNRSMAHYSIARVEEVT